jgi:hypothetical protein
VDTKERTELLRWLIVRSDAMRATYANRAALIVSANAIILAAIVFLIDKKLSQGAGPLKSWISIFVFLSLGLMATSFILALTASITLRKSTRIATRFGGPPRLFFNPGETFTAYNDFDTLQKEFQAMTYEDFLRNACAELWVALRVQQIRYKKLKRSIWFILGAFLSLALALVLVVVRGGSNTP